jgi:hypothetical protein
VVIIISSIDFLGPKKRREAYVLVPPVILGMTDMININTYMFNN